MVLKLYKNDCANVKYYHTELKTLKSLKEQGKCEEGFPQLISHLEGPTHSEILMERLGQSLKNLQDELPGNTFSEATCYLICL